MPIPSPRSATRLPRARALAITVLIALLRPAPGIAAAPVLAHLSPGAGFARIVFDFPTPTAARVQRTGTVVTITYRFDGAIAAAPGFDPAQSANLRDVRFAGNAVILTLAPGVAVHSFSLGTRRALDLRDPAHLPGLIQPRLIQPGPIQPRLLTVRPLDPRPIAAIADTTVAADASTDQTAPTPPAPAADAAAGQTAPNPPATRPPLLVAPGPGGAAVLTLAATTGAAALARGATGLVVFDEQRAIDQASLRAIPGFADARIQQLADAVMLRVPLAPGQTLGVRHAGTDWSITLRPSSLPPAQGTDAAVAAAKPITARVDQGALHLLAPPGGRAVAIPDPQGGGNLLVGTSLDGASHVETARRFAPFALLGTVLGVAIDPQSDQVALRGQPNGFIVESAEPGATLWLQPPGLAELADDAARLTRSLDLPDEASPALLRRLHAQIADAAATPALGRLPYRRAVAQTMLALGMGAEAQGVIQMASEDDPQALDDPAAQMLAAAGALLAGRLDQTEALATQSHLADTTGQPAPAETDEHRLWRALHDAARLPDGAVPDGAVTRTLASELGLLLSYPPTLRRLLLPLVADTLLRGGALADADRLLAAAPADPGLDFARASALQAHGRNDAALAAYDRLVQGRDRSLRARAAVAALDLRVGLQRLSPAAAADAGERLTYAWRGDARERDLRFRVAAWRGQAGQFRQQLEALRDTLDAFPDPADGARQRLEAGFADIVQAPQARNVDRLTSVDLVSLVQENTDLLPDGPAGEAMVDRLADRLAALDLPEQASTVLRQLMHGTTAPATKAAFGARLAALTLGEDQAAAAVQALTESAPGPTATPLSPALSEQRALLLARAHAALGDAPAALASLSNIASASALLTRAQVHEDAHEWAHAQADLAGVAAKALPATGKLDGDQSGVLLRWASAMAQSGDETGLATLRARYAGRLPDPNDAALLAVLTEPPVRAVSDLGRARAEATAARGIPGALEATSHAD